jgi:DNA-binding NtrC family response regulator
MESSPPYRNPIVVYVDDDPDCLFIFERKFGRRLHLKMFTQPKEALAFILASPEVALVITDEVMPGLSGNQLAEELMKYKPNMKIILITGNPNHDADLMYNSLRRGRFYEFIQKPVDFESRGEEYYNLIQGLIASG